jgi:hypothetical protein
MNDQKIGLLRILPQTVFISALALPLGCVEMKVPKSTAGDSENKHEDDTGSASTDSEPTTPAVAAFCHQLVSEGEDVTLNLSVTSRDGEVVLSAVTGSCSSPGAEECLEIPSGRDIDFTLIDDDGVTLLSGTADVIPGTEYAFVAEVDEAYNIFLNGGELPEEYQCSEMECVLAYLTESTCAPDDPCGWANDGYCDDACLDYVDQMFDDAADCSGTGGDTDSDVAPGSATANFCHNLAVDGSDLPLRLLVGGVELSASTSSCNTPPLAVCDEVPTGNAVTVELQAEDGTTLLTGTMRIDGDTAYGFVADLDSAYNLVLYNDALPPELACSEMECDLGYYSVNTCAEEDPCNWSNDGLCDDPCADVADPMFDDSLDCGTDSGMDTDVDTDSGADTGGPEGSASGNFCHALTLDGEETTLRLVIGDVTLLATTQSCSTPPGGACREIPSGNAVSVELQTDDGTPLLTGTSPITAGSENAFIADLDNWNSVVLDVRELYDDSPCSEMECILYYYSESTCAPDDPCGWSGDGYCDEECLNIVDQMFDDSADCG